MLDLAPKEAGRSCDTAFRQSLRVLTSINLGTGSTVNLSWGRLDCLRLRYRRFGNILLVRSFRIRIRRCDGILRKSLRVWLILLRQGTGPRIWGKREQHQEGADRAKSKTD